VPEEGKHIDERRGETGKEAREAFFHTPPQTPKLGCAERDEERLETRRERRGRGRDEERRRERLETRRERRGETSLR